jgi:hypothetical protein
MEQRRLFMLNWVRKLGRFFLLFPSGRQVKLGEGESDYYKELVLAKARARRQEPQPEQCPECGGKVVWVANGEVYACLKCLEGDSLREGRLAA